MSTERDFKYLIMPPNIWEVFDHMEEFIILKVLRLNLKGSGHARAKELV